MANEDLESQEPEKPEEGAAGGEGQTTEELRDIVVLDELPPGVTPDSAPTIVDAQPDDEVYVILPEGDTSEIPVVETEAIDESAETGDIESAQTMPLETHGVGADTEGILDGGTEQIQMAETEPVEARETQNLDELTSEMDDSVLAEAAGNTSEILGMPASSAVLAAAETESAQIRRAGVDSEGAPSSRGSFFKVALAAAAVLALSAAGFWYMGGMNGGFTPVVTTAQPPAVGAGSGDAPPVDPGPTGSGGETGDGDVLVASRAAFRGKLLAALDMGFGGEVKHE